MDMCLTQWWVFNRVPIINEELCPSQAVFLCSEQQETGCRKKLNREGVCKCVRRQSIYGGGRESEGCVMEAWWDTQRGLEVER